MNQHDKEIDEIVKQLKNLDASLILLNHKKEIREIIELIVRVRNGWTTIAEMTFMRTLIDSLASQLEQIDSKINKMKEAAFQVSAHK